MFNQLIFFWLFLHGGKRMKIESKRNALVLVMFVAVMASNISEFSIRAAKAAPPSSKTVVSKKMPFEADYNEYLAARAKYDAMKAAKNKYTAPERLAIETRYNKARQACPFSRILKEYLASKADYEKMKANSRGMDIKDILAIEKRYFTAYRAYAKETSGQ